jgi:hypothetical protein
MFELAQQVHDEQQVIEGVLTLLDQVDSFFAGVMSIA